jgi:hypothetical protein
MLIIIRGKESGEMKRKFYFGIGVVALVLIAAIGIWLLKWNITPEIAPLTVLDSSQLRLTLAWNGETVEVAPPAVLPQSILDSKEFRVWQRVGNATKLVGTDDKSNKVVANAVGIIIDGKGIRRPLIPSIQVFSPAGVLINETTYSPDSFPEVWTLFGTDSKKVQKVVYRTQGKPGTPFIRSVTFFDSDEMGRQYVSDNPEQIVWAEWAVNSEGSIQRKINGGREELVAEFIKQKEL